MFGLGRQSDLLETVRCDASETSRNREGESRMKPSDAENTMAPGSRGPNLPEPTVDAMQSGERGARRFGRLRNGNPPGDPGTATKCLAKTRSGRPCQAPAMRNPLSGNKLRCRMHGGCSTGPKTSEGKERVRMAHWRHGERSTETIARRRAFRSMVRAYLLELDLFAREVRAFLRDQERQQRQREQQDNFWVSTIGVVGPIGSCR
jgi:hypothetical protein